jgi:CheY-like chemotaxis protein
MQLLLGLSGYDAKAAYDGATALKLAREFMPQVVLCDIGLPDKDGYQVARELRELPETGAAFLVALTGYGHADDMRLATAAGFDAFQVKPVEPDALHALISQHFSANPR